MPSFSRICDNIDVSQVVIELDENKALFGEIDIRKNNINSPHIEMEDIWFRYKDLNEMIASGDYSTLCDEHDSIWLKDLPHAKRLCLDVMALVGGERLGGVFITKLPPGGKIKSHIDGGWHAKYYDKYYVPIKNVKGSVFGFIDGDIDAVVGEVWKFDNSIPHWVFNNSNSERIAMVICIKGSS